jgi:hypothetical protein
LREKPVIFRRRLDGTHLNCTRDRRSHIRPQFMDTQEVKTSEGIRLPFGGRLLLIDFCLRFKSLPDPLCPYQGDRHQK